ncbi:MAG: glutamate synthase-related protein [Dehalococcoidales bacterium]|jgi:ferredoxin|nr:glutamate synthase-related protein [Dehalococcoidales bacterium]MDX9986075.1 glutamate synthase-related protein [Dehalococcoidales bacterium]
MPEKYHININETPARFPLVSKYAIVETREKCTGSCRKCVRKNCAFGVFKLNSHNMQKAKERQYLYGCEGCFRCVQECPGGVFSRVKNPDWDNLGGGYWTPDIIHQTWKQAENGRVPVSGAGYRGKFAACGFDSIWTDMSEIVRPTRDGIHGREYINTSVDINRRPHHLSFSQDGKLDRSYTTVVEIPIPLLFEVPKFGIINRRVLNAMVSAASELETLMFLRPEEYSDDLEPLASSIVPRLKASNQVQFNNLIKKCRIVEIDYCENILQIIIAAKTINPDVLISVGIELDGKAVERAIETSELDEVDLLHFYADANGNGLGSNQPRFLSSLIQEMHSALVERGLRFRTNLVFSGGIALAEHLAKAIIYGADALAISTPLLLALECHMCYRCLSGESCPVSMEEIPENWGRQRILNLAGAWRDQLIEVMGAMGIREARRLRGDIGRSMCFENLEKECFGPIFGKSVAKGSV